MGYVGIVLGLHARDRREHRHRGLAHRYDVGVAAEQMQDRDQIVDVVVEIEAALRNRHHARVNPLGDVDVVVGQEALDGAAQQRRVMPDIGATMSRRGCGRRGRCSKARSKCNRRQKGRSHATRCTGTRSPPTTVEAMFHSGLP